MNDQLLFLQPGGVRVPVKIEIFKHGGGLYLAAVNHELGIHVPFVATATVMAAELRAALALIEGANAINDQGHISRAGNGVVRGEISPDSERESFNWTRPKKDNWIFASDDLPENITPQDHPAITMSDLRPGDSEYNWKLLVRRFPWLFAKDFEYKQAAKYAEEIAVSKTGASVDPLASDMALVMDSLDTITRADGSINQSEVGRLIGVPNAGQSNRKRIMRIVQELERAA